MLCASRVVIPPPGRERVLEELHEGHPGISRMKSIARSFVWWPGLDKALDQKVKTCVACQSSRNLPPAVPIQPWEWPERPWSRLHVDYAGPLSSYMFLVVVDAHSKWMDIKMVKNATSSATITALRSMFATHGIPELLVSDNGAVFTSTEFKEFVQQNGIRHTTSAPYHPATNGLAERAVQTFKTSIKKMTSGSLEDRLSKFLFHYRITPHSTTGVTPAELLLGRRPRSVLDLVRPNLAQHVRSQQHRQKMHKDKHSKQRVFNVGNSCMCAPYLLKMTGFLELSHELWALGPLRSSSRMAELFVDIWIICVLVTQMVYHRPLTTIGQWYLIYRPLPVQTNPRRHHHHRHHLQTSA